MDFDKLNFGELTKRFTEDTVPTYLSAEGKKSVEQLGETRRNQINFISYITATLKGQSEASKTVTEKERKAQMQHKTTILYGAMLLIYHQINASLNPAQGSVLRDSLKHIMDIRDEAPFDQDQYLTCYKAITQFLKIVYNDNKSEQGINPKNPLQYVSLKTVEACMRLAWELEADSTKKTLADYSVSDKSTPLESYTVARQTTQEVISSFPEDILADLNALIIQEKGDKKVATVASLSPNRAIQLGFLEKLLDALNTKALSIPIGEKKLIAAGAMHLVREQINLEYKFPLLHKNEISNSLVHKKLTEILKTNDKQSRPEHIEQAVAAALRFIAHTTINAQEKTLKPSHMFASITGFDVRTYCNLSQDIIRTCRDQALTLALQMSSPTTEHTVTPGSWTMPSVSNLLTLGILGGSSKKPVVTETSTPAPASSNSL